jgi:hypothetical protein
MMRVGERYSKPLLHAALFLAQLQDAAHGFVGRDDHGGENGLFDFP